MSKPHLSLAVFGPHNSGKSTLAGHLLFKMGAFERHELEQYELECAEADVPMLKYAWLVDRTAGERKKQDTVDLGVYELHAPNVDFTLVNSPGNRTYQKNFLSALSVADVGLFVIGADETFDDMMEDGAYVKEHSLLAYAYGLSHIVVAVTKMDDAEFSKSRYLEIEKKVSGYLVKKVGFEPDRIKVVPVSGFAGDNLCEKSSRMAWHEGPTLLETLSGLPAPQRSLDKQLRIGIVSVFTIGGVGTVAVGRVDSGTVKPGTPLTFAPTAISGPVETLEVHHRAVDECGPGTIVGIRVRNVFRHEIYRGCIAGDGGSDPPKPVERFTAKIVLLHAPHPINVGYSPIVSTHAAHISCRISEFKQLVDRKSGELLEEAPETVAEGQSAVVEFIPNKALCVEEFSRHPHLGRLAIRDGNRTIGCGIVLSVKHAGQ